MTFSFIKNVNFITKQKQFYTEKKEKEIKHLQDS